MGDRVGLYNPTTATFFLRDELSGGPADTAFRFGPAGNDWTPVAGNWDGADADGIGLYNATTGTFFMKDALSGGPADTAFRFGPAGNDWGVLSGNWNGTGGDGVGLYNATTGTFFLKNALSAGNADITFRFGPAGNDWTAIAGDWNGNGTDGVGLYNAATGTFYLKNALSGGNADIAFRFGPAGNDWTPIVGDWNGDGTDGVGLYNPDNGVFYLKNSLSGGNADATFRFGPTSSSWIPVAGTWETDEPEPPPTEGETFVLTTAVDTVTGTEGDDTIRGVVSATAGESTFQLADYIDGKGGTDAFNLTVSGGVNMPLAEVNNVEKFFIKDLTGGNIHSFASVSGEQEVWTNGSTGNTTITNLDKAAIGVKDITGAAATHTFVFKDTAFQTTAALDVALENAGNLVTGNQQTIDVQAAAAGAANAVNLDVAGKNTVIFASSGTDIAAAGGVKTLTVTGTGSVVIAPVSDVGGGALKTNLTTVNASANSGGVDIQLNKTTVKFTGGSGNDTVRIEANMTKGAEFNLGAGDDSLLSAGGAIDANVVVDAGAGVDTLSNGLITSGNGGIFKNFNKVALDTATTTDIELLTGSTIDSLLINSDMAATIQNLASGSTIDVTSKTGASDVTIGVKGAAAASDDVLTVNFIGADQAATPAAANIKAGNIVAAKVETIDVVSGGGENTWNALQVKGADGLQQMTITGSKNLDLSFAGTVGTNPVAGQGGAVNLIDASAATGKLNIDLANVTFDDKVGFKLEGGQNNDVITTNALSSTLTGNGGDDKYVVTATVAGSGDETTAKITTITDFNAGDMIELGTLNSLTKTQTDISGATNLTEAIDSALKNAAVAAGDAAWFQYSNNTYVVVEDATDGFGGATTNDVIIKLSGLVDLTDATVSANVLTLV